ncbi:hypothetical protein Salmuc_02156 [Salipiger mucosus DSM 16094]|uniref:Lipoprotein n=2 Tax=Salipiger mucosus TaxID=263378 RepID=S9QVC4_9RHOB|nr:hypothetical protein Salmuc_02156 [Salipiger mucosus DSM 16094]
MMTRVALLSFVTVMTGACWPGGDSDPADDIEAELSEKYPAVFKADAVGPFLSQIRPELRDLRYADREEYTSVVRGMAQIMRLKPLTVTVEDMRQDLPEVDMYEGLSDPFSSEFLSSFYEVEAERIGNGGVTFESIKTMGAAHQENAVTKYRNALLRYLEDLRAKRETLVEKDEQLEEVFALISFIQPQVDQDDDTLRINVQTRNGTEQDLSSLGITVAAWETEERFGEPEVLGTRIVSFDTPFAAGNDRFLDVSINAPGYESGPISITATQLTSEAGLSFERSAMEKPLRIAEDMINDAERARRSIQNDLTRALTDFP